MKGMKKSLLVASVFAGLVLLLLLQVGIFILFIPGENQGTGGASFMARPYWIKPDDTEAIKRFEEESERRSFSWHGPGSSFDSISVSLISPAQGTSAILEINAKGIGYFWYPSAWLYAYFSGRYSYKLGGETTYRIYGFHEGPIKQ